MFVQTSQTQSLSLIFLSQALRPPSLTFPSLSSTLPSPQQVHEESTHDFHASGQFAYHTWESLAAHYLEALSPESLQASQSSFGKMAKKRVWVFSAFLYPRLAR